MESARESLRISLVDHKVIGMLQRHPNDRNTLSQLKSTKSLGNIPNESKGLRNIPNRLGITKKAPSWVKIINRLPSESQNREVFPKNHQGLPRGSKTLRQLPRGLWEMSSLRSRELLRKLLVSKTNTYSLMSHKQEEEFFSMGFTPTNTSL